MSYGDMINHKLYDLNSYKPYFSYLGHGTVQSTANNFPQELGYGGAREDRWRKKSGVCNPKPLCFSEFRRCFGLSHFVCLCFSAASNQSTLLFWTELMKKTARAGGWGERKDDHTSVVQESKISACKQHQKAAVYVFHETAGACLIPGSTEGARAPAGTNRNWSLSPGPLQIGFGKHPRDLWSNGRNWQRW